MKIHLVDGTYELFRSHFGAPPALSPTGMPVGATRGLLRTLLALLRYERVSHVACAFDHVIESFRNDLYAGYKTGEGVPAELMAQFPLAERAAAALGIVVWSMVEFEADDAIGTAAERWREAPGVEQVVICSPDKDFAQCVRGTRVVCLDRRKNRILDEAGVIEKFGVPPASIADWLALVGDSADGYPGIPGWGKESARLVLARYGAIDDIPDDEREWAVRVRGAANLARNLRERRGEAALFKRLARLRADVPLPETLDDLRWTGVPRGGLEDLCAEIGDRDLLREISLPRRDA
jgi:5'-3' exonuclease